MKEVFALCPSDALKSLGMLIQKSGDEYAINMLEY